MRRRAALAAALLAASATAVTGPAAPAAAAPDPNDCKIQAGGAAGPFWPKSRLKFDRAWQVTRGEQVGSGRRVLVAVIDSGLNVTQNAQLRGMSLHRGVDVISAPGFSPTDTADCYGHGTAVTSIIAAQPVQGRDFEGIAPDATIMPIKQTHKQNDGSGTGPGLAAGIIAALKAKADVINISVTVPYDDPALRRAVARAKADDVVIVAAAGNDGDENKNRPAYPAAYSTRDDNVIAVSAIDDKDSTGEFSAVGNYVTIAAPGVAVPAASAIDDKYVNVSGTSFATPYVAGAAALVRAAFPRMSAADVRNRLIGTADKPPATTPSARYGWGIVNPYLAVTSLREDAAPTSGAASPTTYPAQAAPPSEDRHLQHIALAAAFVLLGLAVVALSAAAVLRPRRRRAQHPA